MLRSYLIIGLLLCAYNLPAQLTWTEITTPSTGVLQEITMANSQVGYVHDDAGNILKSDDGGWTWDFVFQDNSKSFWSLHVLDEDHVWASGLTTFIMTEDGGMSWEEVDFPDLGGTTSEFDAVYFVTQDVGYVAVYNTGLSPQMQVHRTEDGGETWDQTSYDSGAALMYNFDFESPDRGWACSSGQLVYTDNGGATWTESITGSPHPYRWIDIVDLENAFVVCDSGEVNWTNDATSWGWTDVDDTKSFFEIEVLDMDFGVIVGSEGACYIHESGSWTPQSFTTEIIKGVHILNEEKIWVSCGGGKIYHGQKNPTDIVLEEFEIQDTACNRYNYPLQLWLKNESSYDQEDLYFEVWRNDELYQTHDWTGTIPAGDLEFVDLGTFQMNGVTGLEVKWYGDSIQTNNEAYQFIQIHEELPHGTDGEVFICPNEEVTLTAWGGNSYIWLGIASDGGDMEGETVTGRPNEGIVYVNIGQPACTYLDSVIINYNDCEQTSAFSPNNDEVNDFFFINNIDGLTCDVTIFNKWGDKVNHVSGYNNIDQVWWGDNSRGKAVDAGTYYYVVNFPNNEAEPFSGWVQILK